MDFGILGTLRVSDGEREIPVSGGKQRALLALLLLHGNRPVSDDVLIEALWGDRATAKTVDNLHVLVSRLRKTIGADRIVRDGGGYAIRVAADELDLARFEALRAGGEPQDALKEWRGPPLADFTYEPWAESEIRRLEELRLVAFEERIELDLAAGRHAALVAELQWLVREHPLHEDFRRQLILALYRSGRQAEALDAYRAARRMLDEELGLEPSPALRELERAMLTQDPSLDAPRPAASSIVGGRRRRGALAAAAAALLGFAGAASAVLLERQEGDPRAAAATLGTSSTNRPVSVSGKARAPTSKGTRPTPARRRKRQRAAPTGTVVATPPGRAPPPPRTPIGAAAPPPTPATTTTNPSPKQPPPPPASVPKTRFADDFNDGVINRTLWNRSSTPGVSVDEVNGRVEIAVAATAENGGDFNIIGGTLGTNCRWRGDFDVRVDFELLDWPAANGVAGQLSSWYSAYSATIGRFSSNAGREEYTGWFPAGSNSLTGADRTGTFRLVREGARTLGYYGSDGGWESVVSSRVSGSPTIGLSIYSRDDWFADKPVRIAFDNFVLLAEDPVC